MKMTTWFSQLAHIDPTVSRLDPLMLFRTRDVTVLIAFSPKLKIVFLIE